jgi:hypothetical protein
LTCSLELLFGSILLGRAGQPFTVRPIPAFSSSVPTLREYSSSVDKKRSSNLKMWQQDALPRRENSTVVRHKDLRWQNHLVVILSILRLAEHEHAIFEPS